MSRVQGPTLPGRAYPNIVTVSDALGAMDNHEALTILFHDLAMSGFSVPELVAAAAYDATERLPRGMALTDARPGCWESSLFESMAPESVVTTGPGAASSDLECPICYAAPDDSCHVTEEEAASTVAGMTDGDVRAALDAAGYDTSLPGDNRRDWIEVLAYEDRATPHTERREAARSAVCYAGEWVG